jgi:hypothetical protein
VYTQNIILAIVAEAYEEAKAKLGTADTSFLMLVLMRILFTTLFIIYRIRMLCRDIVYACTGWSSFRPGGRAPSFKRMTSSGPLGASAHGVGPSGPGPDDAAGPGPGAAKAVSGPDLGASCNANSQANQWGPDQYVDESLPVDDAGFALAPTLSRAVLPLDVEKGLAGSYTSCAVGSNTTSSYTSRVGLLGSFGRGGSSQSTQDSTALAAAAYGANGGSSTAGGAGVLVHSNDVIGASGRSLGGLDESKGFRARLSHVWHEIILGERHMLRMYNDVYLATSRVSHVLARQPLASVTRFWQPCLLWELFPVRMQASGHARRMCQGQLQLGCCCPAGYSISSILRLQWRPVAATGCKCVLSALLSLSG